MHRKRYLISKAKASHWSMGLLQSMKDPDFIIKQDNKVVVIKDKYPKARYHFLVIPKADIGSIWDVTKEHENLLLHMEEVGESIIKNYYESNFIIGYHAIPSMYRLHMHVISTDFCSVALKTREHYNSFTTPFFMPSKDVRKQIQQQGKLENNEDYFLDLLNEPLKCYTCSMVKSNLSELKKHLSTHLTTNKEPHSRITHSINGQTSNYE